MKKTTNQEILEKEYALKVKGWKDLYQWKRIVSIGNTEILSAKIIRDFDKIEWSCVGLRRDNFKINNHDGSCQLQTLISQFTEKRFCRALFNTFNITPEPLLGRILDYEIPLTEKNQSKEHKINQGDIDLLAERGDELLFIEAKISSSGESLLKAILEIFVYVMRLKKCDILPKFLLDFGIPINSKITPCVLTFPSATSGYQLQNINSFQKLLELIKKINEEFRLHSINELEF